MRTSGVYCRHSGMEMTVTGSIIPRENHATAPPRLSHLTFSSQYLQKNKLRLPGRLLDSGGKKPIMKSGIGGFSGKDWWEAGYRARKVYSAETVKRYKGQKRTII